MAQLMLHQLECQRTEDASTDEAYLKMDGRRIWGPRAMSKGVRKTLGIPYTFNNDVNIELFDEDGPFDSDDNLGRVTVVRGQAPGSYEGRFTRDDARYILKYDVMGTRPVRTRSRVRSEITATISRVDCRDTEDVGFLGSEDELYIVGIVSGGGEADAVLTPILHLDEGRSHSFPPPGFPLFHGIVPADGGVRFALEAYDEDAAKDWERHEEIRDEVDERASARLDEDSTWADIWQVAKDVWQFFVQHDKDDLLGKLQFELPVAELLDGESIHTWAFKRRGSWVGYSDWDYTVYMRVKKEPLT